MHKPNRGSLLIGIIATATVLLSLQAIVYYIRWFIPFLSSHHSYIAPPDKIATVWFIVKIISNAIFFAAGVFLFRLFWRFRALGYFSRDSLRVLDFFIGCCITLALLGLFETICDNFSELHSGEWSSAWDIMNRVYRFGTHELVLREPQTMFILIAAVLWAIRQFVAVALTVKKENESFI
jgi:hypothetical protein